MENKKINFKITNLHCDACIKISSMALKKIQGVKNVEIIKDGKTVLESDKDISHNEIESVLSEAGKTVSFD